jgi:hypothetical protein
MPYFVASLFLLEASQFFSKQHVVCCFLNCKIIITLWVF